MFRNDNNQFIEAGKEWNIHSFEQADPLMAFYFGHDLANKPGLEIAGESSLAGEKVLVLKGENVRAWISMDSGAVLGIEDDLQSIRVLDIQYDTPLPGQAFQVIPSGDLRPNLDDRPAPAGFDPAGLALQFNWISLDLYDLSKGNLIDIYQGPYYLGSLEIGSAGFYCDRATDGDHFAYLYQGTGLQPVIHWVDLKNINEIHEVSGYDNISTPIWSPDNTKLAFTANSKDSNPTTRKVYLLEIQTGTIRELGEGSHMPPAWTDDGKYVFSLDGYYSHLQVYSLDENGENYVKDFDGDNWQLSDNSFFISNQEIAQKLPRNSFDFLATCAEATP